MVYCVTGSSPFEPAFSYNPSIFSLSDSDNLALTPTDLSINASEQKKCFLIEHNVKDGDISCRVALLIYDDGGVKNKYRKF